MKKITITAFLTFLFSVQSFGQNCPKMSTWDGVAYAIKDYYESNANDPKSIKYSEASLMMEFNNGKFSQRVKIRGKNGFGALVVNEVYFIISGTGTDAKVIATYNTQEFDSYTRTNNIKITRKYDSDGSLK